MIVRPMEPNDLPAVSALENESFSMPWSYAELESCLQKDFYDFFVATEGDALAGYIGMYRVLDEADIVNVAVDKRFRRQGIAAELMAVILETARLRGITAVTLEVRDSNDPAIRLYEKCGFRQIGLRRGYYQKPEEDARIYALALPVKD